MKTSSILTTGLVVLVVAVPLGILKHYGTQKPKPQVKGEFWTKWTPGGMVQITKAEYDQIMGVRPMAGGGYAVLTIAYDNYGDPKPWENIGCTNDRIHAFHWNYWDGMEGLQGKCSNICDGDTITNNWCVNNLWSEAHFFAVNPAVGLVSNALPDFPSPYSPGSNSGFGFTAKMNWHMIDYTSAPACTWQWDKTTTAPGKCNAQ